MKERLKKFYNDHEVAIGLATFVAGTSAALMGVYLLKKGDGFEVDGVFSGTDIEPGSTIFVQLKNGNVLPFTKPTPK